MDNSPEGQRNQQSPDLGEGIKPEDVVYSSQDITSKTLAGEGQEYFTRIKRKKPDLKTRIKNLKQQKAQEKSNKNRKKLSKKQRVILVVVALILSLIIIALIVILFILNQNDKLTPQEQEIQEATSEAESIDTTTPNGQTEFNVKANEIINIDSDDGVTAASDAYLQKISDYEKQGDTNAAFNLRIEYLKFIVEHGDPNYAETLAREIDEDNLDDAQKCSYYAFLYYLYLKLGNPSVADEYKVLMEDLRNKLLEEEWARGGNNAE